MKKSVLHVGVDVDDKLFHIGAIDLETGELFEFKIKPTFGALLKKLEKLQEKGFELKVCYEATYIGYNLCRDLRAHSIECDIVASSLIPEKPGCRVKTDRLDAKKLAEYYGKGLLTPIHIPDEEEEQVRDLIRARSFLVNLRRNLKKHILTTCRRCRLNYREQQGKRLHNWTVTHMNWLTDNINKMEGVSKVTFEVLLYELEKLDEGIAEYDRMIEQISEEDRYKTKKAALVCFRGLGTLSAMTLIAEIGDIKRFNHPKKLTSYAGLDVIEYSSGGKEKKFGITKMGNKRIRTVAIESCQNVSSPPRLSKRLRSDRKDQDVKVIDVADRCMARLKKKANRMQYANKHTNKIKVACAREFLTFIWEALHMVA